MARRPCSRCREETLFFATGVNSCSTLIAEFSSLESHLGQFALDGHLELLDVGGGRAVAGLLWNQSKPPRLIQVPIGSAAIAKRHFPADEGAGPRKLIDRNSYATR